MMPSFPAMEPISRDDLERTRTGTANAAEIIRFGEFSGVISRNERGDYCRLTSRYAGKLVWPQRRGGLPAALELVRGVGPRVAARLRAQGYKSLADLCKHPRFGEDAACVAEAFARGNWDVLLARGADEAEVLATLPAERVVFLDLETCGLGSALPLFLVGLLRWDRGFWELTQLLARDYDEEAAVLMGLARELASAQAIVSYNGRAFDRHYALGRAAVHGVELTLGQLHFDLLRHARRHYRDVLPNCRLGTVEEAVLGRLRAVDEAHGGEIPELYHRFVQTRDPDIMAGILRHNASDLKALAELVWLVENDKEASGHGSTG